MGVLRLATTGNVALRCLPDDRVVVRRARPEDLDSLLELYGILEQEKPSAPRIDRAAAEAILSGPLGDPQRRHLVVADVDGGVCGTADMTVVSGLRHGGSPWAIIEDVVVAEDRRRQGVASEIVRHLLAVARERGCYKVQLLSGKQRTGAHRMYERNGFEAVAEGFKVYFDR